MKKYCWVFLLPLLIWGCEEDDLDRSVNVVTEKILFISGDDFIASGRILSLDVVNVTDHGFEFDEDESFNSPEIISLGERSLPGSFISESPEISIETEYFCRAFIVHQGERKYGNVVPFTTLSPRLTSFSPEIGRPGLTLTITGANFTDDTQVFIDNQEVVVESIDVESSIQVKIPPRGEKFKVDVKVVSQGRELLASKQLEYVIGKWDNQGQIVSVISFRDNIFFEENGALIFGLGGNRLGTAVYNQFFVLDPPSGNVQNFTFNQPAVQGPFYSSNFVGGGSVDPVDSENGTLNLTDRFYERINNEYFLRATAPTKLFRAIGFENQNDFYLYGGLTENRNNNLRYYKYSQSDDTWVELGFAPLFISSNKLTFQHQDNNYFLSVDNVIWKHNTTNDEWSEVTTYPEENSDKGFAVVIGDDVYSGLHTENRRIWKYEILNDRWVPKPSIPGVLNMEIYGSWALDSKVYLTGKSSPNDTWRQFYILDPNAL